MGFANSGRLEPLWICEVKADNAVEAQLLAAANCTGAFCSWKSKADVEARAARFVADKLQDLRRLLRQAYAKARQLEAAGELGRPAEPAEADEVTKEWHVKAYFNRDPKQWSCELHPETAYQRKVLKGPCGFVSTKSEEELRNQVQIYWNDAAAAAGFDIDPTRINLVFE
jgi:hypothetical protein